MIPFQSFRLIVLTLLWLAPAAWAQTPFGNAITLNGTNQYIVVTNFGNIIPTNEVTVEFWADTSVAVSQSAFILNPDSNANRFNAHVNYGTSPAQGVIYWDFGNINSGVGRLGPNNPPVNSISNWVHYAFVASKSGNFMSVYTNGVLLATKSGMTPFVRGTYDLDIGGGSNYFSYHGSLDDFRVWNTALSQAQIQANLGVPLTGSEANLVVYYRFDNSGGTVATNSATATGTLYNGAIMGGAPLVASGVSTAAFLNSVVTSTADNGPGSLRQTVTNALPGSTITFTNTLSGQTIRLTNGQIELSNNVTIDASALTNGMVISGNGTARIFDITNATVLLAALTITNGFGSDGGNYGGGGILNFGNLTLANCTLTGNSESGWIGGAIDAETGTVTMNQCIFSRNSASGSSCFGGGAIGVYAAIVTLNQSTLSSNSVNNSHNGGGGIFDAQGTVVVNECTLSGNSANSSDSGGGGIYNNDGTLVVNQSTVAGNSANNTVGGGGINDFGLGNTMLINSIFAANTATGGQGADIYNNYVSLTFGGTNLVQTVIYNSNATVNGTYLTAAANLVPLGNYGGPTPTMPPLPGSPAIDACTSGTSFSTDQRGFPRIAGPFADIGAVEAGDAIPGYTYGTVVNTNSDFLNGLITNVVSLHNAATFATNNAKITFASGLSGQTITLTSGQINLNTNLTIDASALTGGIQINGNASSRIFQVNSVATVVLNSLTLTNGYTTGSGGAILNGGILTVNQCTISGNQAPVGANGGGGILNDQSAILTMNQSTVVGNQSNAGGGIYDEPNSIVTLNNSTVTGNQAYANGGGFVTYMGTLTINNSTIVGNQAGSFYSAGGGIDNLGILILTNSIVCNNTAASNPNIGGAYGGANILVDSVPQLAPLGNYGGPTQTMPPLPGSPAIDAGAATTFTTDQRGFPRVVGPAPDIGAVEFQASPVVTTADVIAGSLRYAIAYVTNNATITFDPSLSGQTIVLTNGQMVLTQNVTIDGSALPNAVAINGNHTSRLFTINGGVSAVLNTLILTNGYATTGSAGGAVVNSGTLTVNNCTLAGNTSTVAGIGGGAIHNSGTLIVNNSTFAKNQSAYVGGAIGNTATIVMNESTISGNSAASGGGGGIYNNVGTLDLTNSIVAGNSPLNGDIANASSTFNQVSNVYNISNPQVAALGNYGGPIPTMPPLPSSPAIDHAVVSALITDQRGFPRPVGPAPDIGAVEAQVASAANPPMLNNIAKSGNGGTGNFQFAFNNAANADFTVLTTTNLALPLGSWMVLGEVMQPTPGQYQFTDPQTTTNAMRFYRVVSP